MEDSVNLNHQEIMRLEGLVEALKKKIKIYKTEILSFEDKMKEVDEEIEFYSDPKNF